MLVTAATPAQADAASGTCATGYRLGSYSYYTSRDARGYVRSNYPRWGHVSWHKVKMDHCAVKYAVCTSHYDKLGIIGYWDGSKKLILP